MFIILRGSLCLNLKIDKSHLFIVSGLIHVLDEGIYRGTPIEGWF